MKLFLKEFHGNAKVINQFGKKKKVYEILVNNHNYYFIFDSVDSGGKYCSKKVSIPFGTTSFREHIKNGDKPIFVVNIFRELDSNFEPTNNISWIFIMPDEIYSSKPYIEKSKNDASRWIKVSEILNCFQSGKDQWNKKKNVFVTNSKNLLENVKSKFLINEYHSMMNVSSKRFLKDEDYKSLSSIRKFFRDNLIRQGGNELLTSIIDDSALLVASYIKSVRDIKKEQDLSIEKKLAQIRDTNNGILIPYYLDFLFDKHWITFSDNGSILVPIIKDEKLYNELLIHFKPGDILINKEKSSNSYMSYHRKKTEAKNGKLEIY